MVLRSEALWFSAIGGLIPIQHTVGLRLQQILPGGTVPAEPASSDSLSACCLHTLSIHYHKESSHTHKEEQARRVKWSLGIHGRRTYENEYRFSHLVLLSMVHSFEMLTYQQPKISPWWGKVSCMASLSIGLGLSLPGPIFTIVIIATVILLLGQG